MRGRGQKPARKAGRPEPLNVDTLESEAGA